MTQKKKPKMKTVWHVYLDEDYRGSLVNYAYYDSLPFADEFSKMKLFRTKKDATKYMLSELDMIRGHIALFRYCETGNLYSAAIDGGEFSLGVAAYNEKRKIIDAVRFKAVLRTVE